VTSEPEAVRVSLSPGIGGNHTVDLTGKTGSRGRCYGMQTGRRGHGVKTTQ
jgi:hypothetical protein